MNAMTLAEKLLSRAAGKRIFAGGLAVCRPALALGTRETIPIALEYLSRLDGGPPRAPFDARRVVFGLGPLDADEDSGSEAAQAAARDYALAHGVTVFEAAQGMGHQRVIETGRALPGQVAVGADSYTVSYGALNNFATGIGAADLAGFLYCGQVWLRVPATVRVDLLGQLRPGVSAEDLGLFILSRLGDDSATDRALEFGGPGVGTLDMDDRIVLANMAVHTGAKAGLFCCDIKTREFLARCIGARLAAAQVAETPDAKARYAEVVSVDLDQVEPMVATSDQTRRVLPLAYAPQTEIDTVYLGNQIWGRLKHYRQALAVLRAAGGVNRGVRVVVTPGSQQVHAEMEALGMLAEFTRYGAEIVPPGSSGALLAAEATPSYGVASTSMLHLRKGANGGRSRFYLASPAECARAAVTGRLGGSGGRPS